MSLISVLMLGIAGGLLIAAAIWYLRATEGATPQLPAESGRLTDYLEVSDAAKNGLSDLRQIIDVTFGQLINVRRFQRVGSLEKTLAQAGLPFRPAEWVLTVAGADVLFAFILYVRFSFNPIAFLAGILIGLFVTRFLLNYFKNKRIHKFEKQLADAVLSLGSAMRAGFSLAQALQAMVRDLPAPCGTEFRRVIQEMDLGISIDDAMAHMVDRNDSPDLALLAKTISVSRRVGGSMAEVTEKVSEVIREKIKIKGEVRVLTAQVRFSGNILSFLPFALGGFLAISQPNYFDPMFKETLGIVLLIMAGVSVAMGMFLIRRIADIQY